MDLTVRSIREAETAAFYEAIVTGFGGDVTEDDHDRFYANLPLHRTLGAFDGDQIVGTLGEFDFELTVPGESSVRMAGTTVVTVRPAHRRRGVLTEMMRLHLDAAHERGDPIAGLWASETAIYGRFGFGSASDRNEIDIDVRRTTLPAPPSDVTVALLTGEAAKDVIPELYAGLRLRRAGMLSRSDAWWEHRRFYDPEHFRDGASSRRYAVAYRDGLPAGYAMYRQKEKWNDFLPDGTIRIIEVMTPDEDVRRALWHLLSSIDLFPNVNWWNAPVDEPVAWEASNRRIVKRVIGDALWLRILDVPAALEARRYDSDGQVIFAVSDAFCPWAGGTFELIVSGGEAFCKAVDAEPELTLDAAELGALYVGGRSVVELARAGLIDGSREALVRADRMMRTVVPPWCPEVF